MNGELSPDFVKLAFNKTLKNRPDKVFLQSTNIGG
jgi:hypothetical protein